MIEFAEKNAKLTYGLGVLVLLFLFIGSFYNYKMKEKALLFGKTVTIQISDITCSNSTRSRSSIWFKYNNKVHHFNINQQDCSNYHIGDSIILFYSGDEGVFYNTKVDFSEEKWGMILSGAIFIIVILSIFFPKILKFPRW